MILNVNIDHVATLRQARGGIEPSVTDAAIIVQKVGADGITIHLREDRRHIQDIDLFDIKAILDIPINLEMALNNDIADIAIKLQPKIVTIVPERREELTTEGGLDIIKFYDKTKQMIEKMKNTGILVSLFIDPDENQIAAAKRSNTDMIEIHTGEYSNADSNNYQTELEKIIRSAKLAKSLDIIVATGHGLNYTNVKNIAIIDEITELNIGHSIISRAIFSGLENAVIEMRKIINEVR